jgi:transcriptional regulator with XRE-family HTH domain
MQSNNIIATIQQQSVVAKKDIADYLGVSKAFIGMIESNKKSLSTQKLLKLTQLYQLLLQDNTTDIALEITAQQNKLPNTKQNKKDILLFAAIEATMIEKINANGLVLQQKLQMQIDALKT